MAGFNEIESRDGNAVEKKSNDPVLSLLDEVSHSRKQYVEDLQSARRDQAFAQPGDVTKQGADHEVVVNGDNQVTSIKDASGRKFHFHYDSDSGQLNALKNESGFWIRQHGKEGDYGNVWQNTHDGGTWKGRVNVDESGYSYETDRKRVSYALDGAKTTEKLDHGEVFWRLREDRAGNTTTDDYRTRKTAMFMQDGRSSIQNWDDRSLMSFDAGGHLSVMIDGAGQRFRFRNYGSDGQPREITDPQGSWSRLDEETWRNKRTGQLMLGHADVDAKHGVYSFTDLSGAKTSHFLNGDSVTEYGGIKTRVGVDGQLSRQYSDGTQMGDDVFHLSPRFTVKDGRTTGMRLDGKDLSVVYGAAGKDDVHASLRLDKDSPVGAFQDGLVVYSSRQPDKGDQRAHLPTGTVIGLSAKDMEVIDNYKKLNPGGSDLVVVQCYDRKTGGVRYEIYSGLDGTNVVDGDRIKAGQPIGKVSKDGQLNYGVRRNSIHGEAVDIIR